MKKVFAIFCALFLCVLLVIPCFASVPDAYLFDSSLDEGHTGGIGGYNRSLNDTYGGDNMTKYRYSYLDYYSEDQVTVNSSICDLVVDSSYMTWTPHFYQSYYYAEGNLDHTSELFVLFDNTYHSDAYFYSADQITFRIHVNYGFHSTIPTSLSQLSASDVEIVRIEYFLKYNSTSPVYSASLPSSITSQIPTSPCILRFRTVVFFDWNRGNAVEHSHCNVVDSNYSYISDVGPILGVTNIRSSASSFLDTFCNVSAAPNEQILLFASSGSGSSGSSSSGSGSSGSGSSESEVSDELFGSGSNLTNFVFAIFQAPMVLISSMLDFTIFGVNLYTVLKVILTLSLTALVISVIIKIILHFKS